MAGIKQARLEANNAFEQANVPGISASERRKLLLDGASLLQVVQKLDAVGGNKSFGQTNSTGGNADVVLARLPAKLKSVLDMDPANNDLTVIDFFDKFEPAPRWTGRASAHSQDQLVPFSYDAGA